MNEKELERYNKTDEIISKFKNGKERYKRSVLFNKVAQMLVRDMDPYEVIDQLIMSNEDFQNALEQYMHRDTRPVLIEKL